MIDPGIPLSYRPPQVENPLEAIARVQGIKGAQQEQQLRGQQMELGDIELQQRQMELQDQQNMRSMLPGLLQKNNGDWEKSVQDLAPHVSPKTAFGLQTMFLGNAEKRAQIDKAKADAAQATSTVEAKQRDYMGSLALGIKQGGYSPAAFEAALVHGEELNPDMKAHLDFIRQSVAQHPEAIQGIVDNLISGSEAALTQQREQSKATREQQQFDIQKPGMQAESTQKELTAFGQKADQWKTQDDYNNAVRQLSPAARSAVTLPAAFSADTVAQVKRLAVPVEKQPEFDINSMKARMGVMGNSEYDQFLVQYARSLGKTPAQLNPDEGLASFQKFAEMKQDPQMRAAALAQKNLSDVMKRIQLDQMPTQSDAKRLADDIQNHRLSPSQLSEIRGRGNGALGLMIEREMPRGFNWQEADGEYNLAKSPQFQQQVRYMDYVGSSINNVISAADKLANGKIRSLNAVKNWAKDQTNNVDVARFNTDRLEVSDAIAKILQGGGSGSGTSDMKLRQAQDLIKLTDDPAVVRTVAGEIKSLIGNRRSTLTRGTYMENAAPSPAPAAGQVEKWDFDANGKLVKK